MESPDRTAREVRIFWDEGVDPGVLPVAATPSSTPDSLVVSALRGYATVLVEGGNERLSLSDGLHRLQLKIVEGSLLAGPVSVEYRIAGQAAAAQMRTLERLIALRRRGRFGAWLNRPEPRAKRWVRQLRALDALGEGATGRDIAIGLFGRERTDLEWRDRDSSLRSEVRRIVASARRTVNGGYRDLLATRPGGIR